MQRCYISIPFLLCVFGVFGCDEIVGSSDASARLGQSLGLRDQKEIS